MPKQSNLPRSIWTFYFSLLRWAVTEAWNVVDAFLTAIAILWFLIAMFNRELAKTLETNWQGMSRWWSLLPLATIFLWRLLKANYAHFEEVVEKLDSVEGELRKEREQLQQPDVSLIWEWTEDVRNENARIGRTEKDILVHNRSTEWVYNVQIDSVKLSQTLVFEKINEIGPDKQYKALGRWNGRSSVTSQYGYFFVREGNEQVAEQNGWVHKKQHDRGVSDEFLKVPMSLSFEDSKGKRHHAKFFFIYDHGIEGRFEKVNG